jgi:hypothetical protein
VSNANETAEAILIVIKRLFKWAAIAVLALSVLAGVSFYGLVEYEEYEKASRIEEAALLAEKRQKTIDQARKEASAENRKWTIWAKTDPASGDKVGRTAFITSNDGLCRLNVESRINGVRLTGFDCEHFKIDHYQKIEVKFDFLDNSYGLPLEKFSDSDSVYIPSSDYSHTEADYDRFLKNLVTGNSVAFKVKEFDGYWVVFTLKHASETIGALGKKFD